MRKKTCEEEIQLHIQRNLGSFRMNQGCYAQNRFTNATTCH